MPATLLDMLDRSVFMATRNNVYASFLDGGIVKMADSCDHAMALVRKEWIILVQWERRTLLRWFNEHLVMVQLHIRATNHISGYLCQAFINKEARKGCRLKLNIM